MCLPGPGAVRVSISERTKPSLADGGVCYQKVLASS